MRFVDRVRVGLIGVVFAALTCPANARTLDEAIAEAMGHAPVIARAEAEERAADGVVMQARGAALPSATIMGSIGTGHIDPQGFFGLSPADTKPRSAQAVIEQPLFAGGAVSGAIDQAKAGRTAARAGVTTARAELAAAVAEGYSSVIVADRQREQFAQLEREMREILRQARLRFQTGESPSTDVSQAEARLAEAQAGFAQAEGAVALSRARFRNLVGSDPGTLAPLPRPPEIPATLDEAVDIAFNTSPRLVQAKAALDAANAAVRISNAGRLPTVSGFAEAASVRDQFFPDYAADSYSVGVRARWTLFASGRTQGKVSEARGHRDAAEADLRAAKSDIEEAVIAAWQNLRTARDIRVAADAQDRASQQALRSVRLEVQSGAKPQLALLDAEREAIVAATRAVETESTILTAAYRLRALLGIY